MATKPGRVVKVRLKDGRVGHVARGAYEKAKRGGGVIEWRRKPSPKGPCELVAFSSIAEVEVRHAV